MFRLSCAPSFPFLGCLMPEVLHYFKALADETRLRLLNVLYRH